MDLSIVILSFNTKKILEDCLRSIFPNTQGLKVEVIVVDNASSDGSPQMVEEKFSQVVLIKNQKNLGFTKGNNQALRRAKGEFILLLNSDTLLQEGAVGKLVRFMESHPEAGAVGPKLLNKDGTSQSSAGSFPSLFVVLVMLFREHFWSSRRVRGVYGSLKEVDWLMGAALMVRRGVLKEAGLLDENIFMYYDEVEWCYRIKKAGFKIYYYPKAEITHLWQKSSPSGRKGPILANYRGLVYFYKKHKNFLELLILRFMLKLKALAALGLGYLTNNSYLKETYAEAYKLV